MSIRFDEDPFAKNAHAIGKTYHEVILFMNFLQTKPQVRIMNIKYYDLYYTVIENRKEKQNVDNQNENHFININVIVPNHYIGRKK